MRMVQVLTYHQSPVSDLIFLILTSLQRSTRHSASPMSPNLGPPSGESVAHNQPNFYSVTKTKTMVRRNGVRLFRHSNGQ